MIRDLKSKSLVLSLAILLTSCSTSLNLLDSNKALVSSSLTDNSKTILTKEEISERDKEYSFSTKALTATYFKRKLQKLVSDNQGTKIVKELEYARIKGESKIPVQAMFLADSTFYTTVTSLSDVQNSRVPSGNPLDVFLGSTVNPLPSLPSNLSTTNASSSGFTANWGAVSGATSYDIILDTGLEINILSPTITYNFSSLSSGNHTWKVRANNVNGSSSYTSDQSVTLVSPLPSNVILVDDSAIGGSNDGTSWANAYISLQDALINSTSGKEIWVAAGTYKPTTISNSYATFTLKNGVAIYGGFSGTETLRNQRNTNPSTNQTILSGDLDDSNSNNSGDSKHVVTGATGGTIDGFTIKYGYAISNGEGGGGMYNSEASPIVSNIIFSNNFSKDGGAMANLFASPTLTNVTFSNNSADFGGGGMSTYGNPSSPTLTNVTFSNNTSNNGPGGGMSNENSSPTLTNVIFINNSAPNSSGGGMVNYNSSPILSNVTFINNSAPSGSGGGMVNSSGTPSLTNVTFSGNSSYVGGGMYNMASTMLNNVIFANNSASYSGGAMYNEYSNQTLNNVIFFNNVANNNGGAITNTYASPNITNAIFYNNSATIGSGGAIYNNDSPATPTIKNTIIWGNTASANPSTASISTVSSLTITYSNIQGGYAGTGNIDNNPLFADINDTDGIDNIWATADDGLRLQSASPSKNTGDNTGSPSTDITGLARPKGTITDMGAYEFDE